MSRGQAVRLLLVIWCISILGTAVGGWYSEPYLIASGTFCFYNWSSFALIFFAWPMAVVALLAMMYWYIQILRALRALNRDTVDSAAFDRTVTFHVTSLIVLFLCTYSVIVSLSILELSGRRASAWHDVLAASLVLCYWVFAPFAYAKSNAHVGILGLVCCTVRKRNLSTMQTASSITEPSSPDLFPTKAQGSADSDEIDVVIADNELLSAIQI